MNQLTISKLLFKYILIKKCLLHRELYQKYRFKQHFKVTNSKKQSVSGHLKNIN